MDCCSRFFVCSRSLSAALPVGASKRNDVPFPWESSMAWINALMMVVFPVPAAPIITDRGFEISLNKPLIVYLLFGHIP